MNEMNKSKDLLNNSDENVKINSLGIRLDI